MFIFRNPVKKFYNSEHFLVSKLSIFLSLSISILYMFSAYFAWFLLNAPNLYKCLTFCVSLCVCVCFRSGANVIMRRHKSVVETPTDATATTSPDDDRPMRRVSYLRATANDSSLQMLDSDDSESVQSPTAATTTPANAATSPSSAEAIDAQTLAQQLKR